MKNRDIDEQHPPDPLDFVLPMPETINRHLDQMYLLGDAGHDVLRVIATLASNKAVIENINEAIGSGITDYEDRFSDFTALALRGMAACDRAVSSVDQIQKTL